MASPSHARWIAPAALLAALLAVAIVYSSSTGGEGSQGGPPAAGTSTEGRTSTSGRTSTTPAPARTTQTTTTSEAESYTVQSGDTLGSIAEATGTTVAELQELNPGVDSQSLSVGQQIKLR
jgi:teichoic acid transport system ATP-binding protein